MPGRDLVRTILLLAAIAVLAVPLSAVAQAKKVLFDAGHAQTAGNADWVVDEDTCGSAQRFPTPAQSGITSSTAETYWSGAYSAFGVDVAKAGYQIETLPHGVAITYGTTNAQDLSNYNVFIIPEPNVRLTSAEKSAIIAFVQNGGGLFMISDHSGSDRNSDGWDSPMIFNDLGSDTLFGIHFQSTGEANNNIVDHPDVKFTADPASIIVRTGPFGVPTKGIGLFNGTTFTLSTAVNPTVKGHIWATAGTADTPTQVTFATATYGSGRVAAIGDSSPSEDATNSCGHTTYLGWNDTTYDNAKVHLNAIAWLAASCTPPATPTAANSGPICAGATLSLSTPAVTGATYSWTGPNGFTSSSRNPSLASATAAASGTYSVTVTVSGCTSAAGTTAATVNADTTSPVVTAPAAITIDQTLCCGTFGGATSATSAALAAFLAGGSATDDCTASPTRLSAQIGGADVTSATCFQAGTTGVTFRFQDGASHVGTAASTATVRIFGDLNLDGIVDPTDMVVLRAYFNLVISPGTAPFGAPLGMADLDHDAAVDPSDAVILRAYINFAVGCLVP